MAGRPRGGDDVAFRAVFARDGWSPLGRRLGPFEEESFSTLEALVDLGGDGEPEALTSSRPGRVRVVGADGRERAASGTPSCDCGC